MLDGAYRRSLRLPHGAGVVELRPADGHVHARYWLTDLRDLSAAMQRSRALLDLDSDPDSVTEVLGKEALLAAVVRGAPGRRVPGAVDGHELAVSAVLGQQVSVGAAATLAGRLTTAHGDALKRPLGTVTHVFPSATALAGRRSRNAGDARRPPPRAARACRCARERGARDRPWRRSPAGSRTLTRAAGIGLWTAEYIAMRALRDPDAFPPGDLGVRHALEQLGYSGEPASATKLAERWRPYRAYAVQHLWASLAAGRARQDVPTDPNHRASATPVSSPPETRPSAEPCHVLPHRRLTV